ncbi:hypothetical protein D3C87_1872220 [compost metagenome]
MINSSDASEKPANVQNAGDESTATGLMRLGIISSSAIAHPMRNTHTAAAK